MELNKFNLQLFADGSLSGGEGGNGTSSTESGELSAKQDGIARKSKNPLANVKYGKQPEKETVLPDKETDEEPQNSEENAEPETLSPEDRKAAYAKMKAEYKDLYDNEVQGIVKSRLKGAKDLQSKLDTFSPLIDTLARRYGVSPDDTEALQKAIESDDSYYEKEAERKGEDIANYTKLKKLENENESMRRIMEEQNRKNNADKLFQGWFEQSEEVKKKYPDFNLKAEMQNERFMSLIQTPGVDLKTAYELIHHDELFASFGQKVAQEAQKRAVNNIKANGARPSENGTKNNSPAMIKSDVRSLTKADREEISRRVLRGETIVF